MNQKLIKIIVVLFIILVIVGVCIFIFNHKLTPDEKSTFNEYETGSFNKMRITIKGYTIDINSKEAGHPSKDSHFETSFDIIDNNHYTNTYNVDFIDLKLDSETSDDGIAYDIAKPEEVTINGKEFDYYLDDFDGNATSAELYYRIPDGVLIIKVSGVMVFDSNGKLVKTSALVDREVLESNELAGILNFTVNK